MAKEAPSFLLTASLRPRRTAAWGLAWMSSDTPQGTVVRTARTRAAIRGRRTMASWMKAGQVIDRIAARGLRTALPAPEWKRSRRRFAHAVNDIHHIVELQASRTNEGVRGKFTINLAVGSIAAVVQRIKRG
jgi:hypothetical protein